MKDRRLTLFAIVGMLCVGLLFFFYSRNDKKRYSWSENYRAENDQPYGTLFIRKLLEGYRDSGRFTMNKRAPLRMVLEDVDDPGNTDYVFIGHNVFLDSESVYALAAFIEGGGDAFIASQTPPEQILNSVYFQECGIPVKYEEHRARSVTLNFYHRELSTEKGIVFGYRRGLNEFPYEWRHMNDSIFCDSTRAIVALGYQDTGRVNFVKISVGRGNLYLHSNPLTFTNYFLTDEEKLQYASSVFSHLDGNDIIWDEFSKVPMPGNDNSYDSPLYYILEQPSLKYAWWLLLLTVVIYAIFAARRKQRIIPVYEPKTNTSLEFVDMISRLHYKNGNHLDMAHKKMKYFLYFVRSKYGIHAEKFGDEQMRRLAEKARVDFADVKVIFSRYYLIEERFKHNIEANRLVDLSDSIDHFYQVSK